MTKRTHTCGELTEKDDGATVTLCGWVDTIRNLGGIEFARIRDRYGFTQVVFDPQNESLFSRARSLGPEFCVAVTGTVRKRPPEAQRSDQGTGMVEVLAKELEVFSTSEVPPIYINIDDKSSEELRLKYRYLDLRKPLMRDRMITRHVFTSAVRDFLNAQGFLEIETPVLTRSTPEGARDFLVPSRLRPGRFYALPQSPQLFKQLLMVSGFDRYFQIAKCYRDEDLRADRQPEHTQIDVEMSFVDEEDVFSLAERLMKHAFECTTDTEVSIPFRRLTHEQALLSYGSDKPDTRYGMEQFDFAPWFRETSFAVIANALDKGYSIRGFVADGLAGSFSRKRLEEYTEAAKTLGLGGLLWIKIEDDGSIKSSIMKHCSEQVEKLIADNAISKGSIVFFSVGPTTILSKTLGELRKKIISEESLSADGFEFLWVTDFPMFSLEQETQRVVAEHHPFTMPNLEDLEKYGMNDPLKIRSRAYDLVINGVEVASGSVRIHRQDIQRKVFEMLGLSNEEAQSKFGFLLEAFKYGPPPHAGIAPGLDRLVALVVGSDSIRDVIAFPKTASGSDLMTGAPSDVSPDQLKELHLRVKDEED